MSEKILEIKDERLSFFTPAGEVKALNGVSFSMNQAMCWVSSRVRLRQIRHCLFYHGLTAYPGRLVAAPCGSTATRSTR